MSIAALIRKPRSGESATATFATDATQPLFITPHRVIEATSVATVASVAVAKSQEAETAKPDGVIGKPAATPTTVASVATVAVATLPDADRHHTWIVTLPTGERHSSMFCPPLSLAEVQARYPGAEIAREPDPGPAPSLPPDVLEVVYAYLRAVGETDLQAGQEFIEAVARNPEQLRGLYADVVKLGLADWPDAETKGIDLVDNFSGTAKAVCSHCAHWTPDRINPAGGIGRCTIAAPASKRIGSLWPGDGVIHCREFQEVQP